MEMQDFLLALTTNVSHGAFWLAIIASILGVLCVVGFLASNKEFEEIELLSLVKTFIPLALMFWALSSLPDMRDVKKVQEEFTRKPAASKKVKKEVKKEKETPSEKET